MATYLSGKACLINPAVSIPVGPPPITKTDWD
jgi:hypothetical protein